MPASVVLLADPLGSFRETSPVKHRFLGERIGGPFTPKFDCSATFERRPIGRDVAAFGSGSQSSQRSVINGLRSREAEKAFAKAGAGLPLRHGAPHAGLVIVAERHVRSCSCVGSALIKLNHEADLAFRPLKRPAACALYRASGAS
jgi:hypothetical protein